jgi:hypothetical protein
MGYLIENPNPAMLELGYYEITDEGIDVADAWPGSD